MEIWNKRINWFIFQYTIVLLCLISMPIILKFALVGSQSLHPQGKIAYYFILPHNTIMLLSLQLFQQMLNQKLQLQNPLPQQW